jgi:phage/plasmid primase-like uncharacterized protein
VKTYLEVPFAENDRAKEKGARFDMSRKQWYCPDGVDLMLFKRWVPGITAQQWGPALDAQQEKRKQQRLAKKRQQEKKRQRKQRRRERLAAAPN